MKEKDKDKAKDKDKEKKKEKEKDEKVRPLPPAEHRWKKGVSGNPRGRPKKRDSLTGLLEEEIVKICPADRERRTWIVLLVRSTLQQAIKGNHTALKEIWERLDGKIPQSGKLQLGGPDGRQITINVVYDDSATRGTEE